MRRNSGWLAIAVMLLIGTLVVTVYGSSTSKASLGDRTLAVARGLRCPVCQGESVADSQSGISRGMRVIIRRKLQQGLSTQEIDAYFVSRYGEKILLAPSSGGIGGIAWVAPPLLVVGGFGLLAALVLDWRGRSRTPLIAPSGEYLDRVRDEYRHASAASPRRNDA